MNGFNQTAWDAMEQRTMDKMEKDMFLLGDILTSLEAMPHATLENVDTPEYETKYAAWKEQHDQVMARAQQRIAERKADLEANNARAKQAE